MSFTIGAPLDPQGTGGVYVNLPGDPTLAGMVRILNSDGDHIDTTENHSVRTSTSNLIFYEQVDGNTVNTLLWNPYDVSGMTITQANGFITLNAGQSIATGTWAVLKSNKYIPMYGLLPLLGELTCKILNVPEANATVELGLGTVSGTSAPTDGLLFRWAPTGAFYAVMNNSGAETQSANLAGQTFTDTGGDSVTLPPTGTSIHTYAIEVVEDHVIFYIDDIEVADIQTPAGQAYPVGTGRQQVFLRVYNGGTSPSLFPQVSLGQCTIKQEDLNQNKPWFEILTALGRGSYQAPLTFAQTSNHVNSTVITAGTLSNTTPPFTSLKGTFPVTAVAGSLATDYLVTSYTMPTGYQFNGNKVHISVMVQGIAVVTAAALEFYLGINASADSLATVDGAGTWGARIEPLGSVFFPTLSAIGTVVELVREFHFVVDSGRRLQLIMRVLNGAATASLVYRINFSPNGYFE